MKKFIFCIIIAFSSNLWSQLSPTGHFIKVDKILKENKSDPEYQLLLAQNIYDPESGYISVRVLNKLMNIKTLTPQTNDYLLDLFFSNKISKNNTLLFGYLFIKLGDDFYNYAANNYFQSEEINKIVKNSRYSDPNKLEIIDMLALRMSMVDDIKKTIQFNIRQIANVTNKDYFKILRRFIIKSGKKYSEEYQLELTALQPLKLENKDPDYINEVIDNLVSFPNGFNPSQLMLLTSLNPHENPQLIHFLDKILEISEMMNINNLSRICTIFAIQYSQSSMDDPILEKKIANLERIRNKRLKELKSHCKDIRLQKNIETEALAEKVYKNGRFNNSALAELSQYKFLNLNVLLKLIEHLETVTNNKQRSKIADVLEIISPTNPKIIIRLEELSQKNSHAKRVFFSIKQHLCKEHAAAINTSYRDFD